MYRECLRKNTTGGVLSDLVWSEAERKTLHPYLDPYYSLLDKLFELLHIWTPPLCCEWMIYYRFELEWMSHILYVHHYTWWRRQNGCIMYIYIYSTHTFMYSLKSNPSDQFVYMQKVVPWIFSEINYFCQLLSQTFDRQTFSFNPPSPQYRIQ